MQVALQQALTCPVVLQAGGTRPHLRVLLRLWPIPFHDAQHLDVSLQQPMSWCHCDALGAEVTNRFSLYVRCFREC